MSTESKSVLELLYESRDLLREAKDKANMGTAMMIGSIEDELSKLIERTENIHENGSTEANADE